MVSTGEVSLWCQLILSLLPCKICPIFPLFSVFLWFLLSAFMHIKCVQWKNISSQKQTMMSDMCHFVICNKDTRLLCGPAGQWSFEESSVDLIVPRKLIKASCKYQCGFCSRNNRYWRWRMKSMMLFLINLQYQHHRNLILDQLILALSVSVLINNKN